MRANSCVSKLTQIKYETIPRPHSIVVSEWLQTDRLQSIIRRIKLGDDERDRALAVALAATHI